MLSPDPLTIPYAFAYLDPRGTFYLLSQTRTVQSSAQCRELIAYTWKRQKSIAFASPGRLNVGRFASVWDQIEERVGVAPAARSVVHTVRAPGVDRTPSLIDYPNVLVIDLAPFWLRNKTNRQFATLFIRMLAMYPKRDLASSIKAYPLANHIPLAINHFLSGATHPTYRRLTHGGLVGYFNGRTKDQIEKMLVRPVSS